MTTLKVSNIRTDGGTQSRAVLSRDIIDSYADDMEEGAKFPPVVVFHDGQDYWLADGFHRIAAARQIGLMEFAADIKQGTRRDAILYSVGANANHGFHRSNADKRRAVMTLLEDDEWRGWSDNEIAKRCVVSNHLVATIKKGADTWNSPSMAADRTFIHHKTGQPTTMNVSGIQAAHRADEPIQVVTDYNDLEGEEEDDYYDEDKVFEHGVTITDEWGTEEHLTIRSDQTLVVVDITDTESYKLRASLHKKCFDLLNKAMDIGYSEEEFTELMEELRDTVTEYRNEMKAVEEE